MIWRLWGRGAKGNLKVCKYCECYYCFDCYSNEQFCSSKCENDWNISIEEEKQNLLNQIISFEKYIKIKIDFENLKVTRCTGNGNYKNLKSCPYCNVGPYLTFSCFHPVAIEEFKKTNKLDKIYRILNNGSKFPKKCPLDKKFKKENKEE
jgi:hypothetical protein